MFKFLKNVLNKKEGSFLIEVLLSIVILSVSITLIVQSMAASLRSSAYSSQYLAAVTAMDNLMTGLVKEGTIQDRLSRTGVFTLVSREFPYQLTTEDARQGNDNFLNRVTLETEWTSGSKKNKIQLETYLFKAQQ